jgi:transcriptional regulator with XRE-family HTH domain
VSIGGALAEARSEAGLSVTEVSERTRIRAAIIRDIERDDFAACGGDFYARGHIRAIAKVVGTDPVPLIAEYDAARLPYDDLDGLAEAAAAAPDALSAAIDPVSAGRPAPKRASDTEPIPPVIDSDQDDLFTRAAVRARLAESGQAAGARMSASARACAAWLAQSAQAAAGRLAAQSDRIERSGRGWPGGPGGVDRAARGVPPRLRLTAALALALLVAIGLLIYLLVSGSAHSSAAGTHSGVAAKQPHRAPAARHHPSAVSPAARPSAVSQPSAVLLTPAGIAAFGPGGTGGGDDPQTATLAIDGNRRTGWHTAWYTTPDFGRLQSGTGLLLDMGQPVAISSASIIFGPRPGGTVELRVGNSPALARLNPVAQAADDGGTVTVQVSRPIPARYLLIWITRLPPDNSGTYQAFIYDITVRGAR